MLKWFILAIFFDNLVLFDIVLFLIDFSHEIVVTVKALHKFFEIVIGDKWIFCQLSMDSLGFFRYIDIQKNLVLFILSLTTWETNVDLQRRRGLKLLLLIFLIFCDIDFYFWYIDIKHFL